MAGAAKALAEIPHRRKAVLLVSQGIPVSLEEIITNPNALGAFQGLRDFIVTAQRSNVAIYPVDPCGLSRDAGCSIDTQEHLRSIAAGTGAFAVLNTNAPELGVERMMAENGAYYLLGYYSPAPPNDGKRHRIKVRVNRADVKVRAREGYVAPRQAAPASAALPLDALISAPIQTRGLPMHVAAVPVPLAERPGSAIALSIELGADAARSAGQVAFAVVAVDVNGKVRARQNFSTGFTPASGEGASVARIATRVDVPAGRYQVRIAAAAKGTQGSVFTEVEVPQFDKPISLGGLALTMSGSVPQASAEQLGGVLPSLPIAARHHPPVRVTHRTDAGEDHAQSRRRDHISREPRRFGWPDHRSGSDDVAGIRVPRRHWGCLSRTAGRSAYARQLSARRDGCRWEARSKAGACVHSHASGILSRVGVCLG